MDTLKSLIQQLEMELPKSNTQIFAEFSIPSDYPWSAKMTDASNMYACLYGLAVAFEPRRILEIGTYCGLGTMALSLACTELESFVTVDLRHPSENGCPALPQILINHFGSLDVFHLFVADTQPHNPGDNKDQGTALFWFERWQLVKLLSLHFFDILFIDGKHTGCGLFSDLWTFWPFVKDGGLVICDDLHDPKKYPEFDWVPDTWENFHYFLKAPGIRVQEAHIWEYPIVPSGPRPIGLILKGST